MGTNQIDMPKCVACVFATYREKTREEKKPIVRHE